ncbi:DOT1-domain-containing protein [Dendrothele bispora CBS 962.96]|uniref:Histone-lysine N-methyltransferase, H3 lysine-79 specific n=1 Tax=Dendrothele bispora (strain CBS 962.96) TaxID=1314807 RepID=A0A4S8MU33_DENBC|nr:DOT1-domain-containing protein [Dendrothele bispora CBS 962.96]
MLSKPIAASTDLGFFSQSRSKSAPSLSPSSSTVTTTTRVIRRPQPHTSPPSIPSHSSSNSSSPLSSPPSSPPHLSSPSKKRKSPTQAPRPAKKARAEKREPARKRVSPRSSGRLNAAIPSPEPIYRSSRSRSTSLFPAGSVSPKPARYWATSEDGDPGGDHSSSAKVVEGLMKNYKAYFRNPEDPDDTSFEPHPEKYPWVMLEYPNSGASEKFILLAPKDKDHYSPILDLEKTLYVIAECKCSCDEQRAELGTIPSESLAEAASPPPSPSPSPPNSRASTSSHVSSASLSSLTSISSCESPPPRVNYLRAVQRAIHRQDGPLFVKSVNKINEFFRKWKGGIQLDPFDGPSKAPNVFMERVKTWRDLPQRLLMRIIEENYQRCVGPHVRSLKRYEAFTSEVYGELMPSLVYEIVQETKLNENSLFIDLGSGVGNIVVQASLQTGCKSYGIEVNQHPARVAERMMDQFRIRCRMWGVRVGEMEVEKGDMLKNSRVDELMREADVVLVDNKVFEASLNEALRPKFLDLKEGAYVVSLKPFVSSVNARVTERNVDDISAIFDVQERPYYPGAVSWGNGGGSYYVHRVDRKGYADIRERFENSRSSSGRSSRSRSKWCPSRSDRDDHY